MLGLRKSKSSAQPWPSLYRGASIEVDGVGLCVVDSRASDSGRDYIVTDEKNVLRRITPTIMVIWSECQNGDTVNEAQRETDKS